MRDKKTADKIYSIILRLYPREFRERFGAEMEQNFSDLSREYELRNKRKWLRMAWLFGDAALHAGIENIAELKNEHMNAEISSSRRFAAVVGLVTILPGIVMMALLFLGIEPPLGPFREALSTPPEGPTFLGIGPFIALGIIVVLPVVGLIVSGALDKNGKLPADALLATGVGILITAPMIVLQTTVGRSSYSNFPAPLFGIIWLLTALFAVVAIPTVRAMRNRDGVLIQSGLLMTRFLFLLLIGIFWAGIVTDQIPCFLGVPNCD